jgi:hypothetical protein
LQAIQLDVGRVLQGQCCRQDLKLILTRFQCNWEIQDDAPTIKTPNKAPPQPPPDPLAPPKASSTGSSEPVRLSYLTEQTCHHPPVSAFWVSCPARGLTARGFDQISAKFTGTAIRVSPGQHNTGIWITLHNRDDEEYQLTHPIASLGGLLRGSLSISVADVCYITCPKTKMKVILQYLEEGWVGKSKNAVVGVIFRYDPSNDKYTRAKDVPEKDILARIEGCWQEQIYYTIPNTAAVKDQDNTDPTTEKQLLIDLVPLMPVPKIVPPEAEQLPNESRRFWHDVTESITSKRFGDATRIKQELEQKQRDKAKSREEKNITWKPRFFIEATTKSGKPDLTEEGRRVLEGMQKLDFQLEDGEGGMNGAPA